jgi:hypothetical protein
LYRLHFELTHFVGMDAAPSRPILTHYTSKEPVTST